MKTTNNYVERIISTAKLVIPRETYQRPFSMSRAQKIAAEFDERIANEPKVSFRDGKYFVFDGQHTIVARKILNDNKDVLVKCKVYYGMTEYEESLLFAQQTGVSAPLSAGARIRAEIFGNEPIAVAFYEANTSIGLQLDYDQERGLDRIGCIKTAFDAYKRIGEERYKEAMTILKTAWDGEPDSFRAENVLAITYFIDLYHDEYCPQRLVTQLQRSDPLTIYREGRAMGVNLAGYKKYLFQLLCIYNGNSKKYALPMKF